MFKVEPTQTGMSRIVGVPFPPKPSSVRTFDGGVSKRSFRPRRALVRDACELVNRHCVDMSKGGFEARRRDERTTVRNTHLLFPTASPPPLLTIERERKRDGGYSLSQGAEIPQTARAASLAARRPAYRRRHGRRVRWKGIGVTGQPMILSSGMLTVLCVCFLSVSFFVSLLLISVGCASSFLTSHLLIFLSRLLVFSSSCLLVFSSSRLPSLLVFFSSS